MFLEFKFAVGDEVHSSLYHANGVVSLRRYLEDKAGGEIQYEIYFRVNGTILIGTIEEGHVEPGHKSFFKQEIE